MTEWLGIALFVLAILIVVMVHEGGHFLFAKLFHMKVQSFFLGFGPRVWSIRRGETEYGLRAIPAGGFVSIAGMNPYEDVPPEEHPRTFASKPVWKRAVVIAAGPFSHFVMAFVFLALYFAAIGAPSNARPVIAAVQPTLNGAPSPAAQARLEAGDRILAIDGRPVGSIDAIIAATRSGVGEPMRLTLERDGRTVTVAATPVLATVDGKQVGRLGVSLAPGRVRVGPFTAVARAGGSTGRITAQTVRSLGQVFGPAGLRRIGQLVTGQSPRKPSDVASVVGGARLAGEAVQSGNWDFFFGILVVLNVFVGLVNLIPLPPLDGGHLAALAYEKIRHRAPDMRKLAPLTAAVAVFLILFSLSLIYIDITNPIPNPFR